MARLTSDSLRDAAQPRARASYSRTRATSPLSRGTPRVPPAARGTPVAPAACSAPPDWSGERRRSGAGCWNPMRCSRAPLPSEFPRNPDGARAAPEWGGGVICVDIGWCRGGTGIAEKAISNRRTTCVPTQPLVCRNDQKELIRPTSSRRGLLSGSCNSSKGGTSKQNRWSCKIITWTNVEIK